MEHSGALAAVLVRMGVLLFPCTLNMFYLLKMVLIVPDGSTPYFPGLLYIPNK